MKKIANAAILGIAISAFLTSCQTVDDQAPVEIKQAAAAVKAARAADVEDYMPSAMAAAERKLDKSIELLKDSTAYSKDGVEGQAKGTQSSAITVANEAKAIAEGGVELVNDMKAYDSNSGKFLAERERTAKSKAYDAQLSKLESENVKLANQPTVETIPADFRMGKPVAYFTSGSTVLSAKYRAEVEELARLVKENEQLHVKLEGFADPRGSVALNKKLADKRLQAVADVLEQNGVGSDRLKIVSVGATADQSTAAGQGSGQLQLDRKVTATVMTNTENTNQ